MRQRPGQLGLFGDEVPAEQADRRLTVLGFKAIMANGHAYYADPFHPRELMTARAARRLLDDRMAVVGQGGWRVHYPEGRHVSARLGMRRATQEGAWHELRGYTGGHPHPGVWIEDGFGKRVWPPLSDG